jgi:hypothetical protein
MSHNDLGSGPYDVDEESGAVGDDALTASHLDSDDDVGPQ